MVKQYISIGSPVALDFQNQLNFSSMLTAISNLIIETEIEHAQEIQLPLEMKGYRATVKFANF